MLPLCLAATSYTVFIYFSGNRASALHYASSIDRCDFSKDDVRDVRENFENVSIVSIV